MKSILLTILFYLFPGVTNIIAYEYAFAKDWRAGIASVIITPEEPVWMAGYASRNRPAEGTLHDLWAKALVLEDTNGERVVIISSDITGFTKIMSDNIRDRLESEYGLTRAQILLNSSHTHTGPEVDLEKYLWRATDPDPRQAEKIRQYNYRLEKKIVGLVGDALNTMGDARIFTGNGVTRFAVNRRNNSEASLHLQDNIAGPSDHSVPVLKVTDPAGAITAIVFGYACHTTVLADYKWSGDYAGFAQIELEKMYPGATSVFLQGAGADQNPIPRRSVALAEQYGKQLAAAVDRVIKEEMTLLEPSLKVAYSEIDLQFADIPTREQLAEMEKELTGYHSSWATYMLSKINRGEQLMKSYPYPLQVWRIGNLPVFSMGGEVVVEYSLNLKRIFGPDIFVFGYSNDPNMAYIPTLSILAEGGYEGESSQRAKGLPGKWMDNIEDVIFQELTSLAEKAGVTPAHGYSPQSRPADWQAGAASVDITPDLPMWMAGYGSRNKPGDEVAHPLYAKALAIKDANEKISVIVTVDILGIPKTLRKTIESAVLEKYEIEPAYLMINASHTHGGPEVRGIETILSRLDPGRTRSVNEYRNVLESRILNVIGEALSLMAPAELAYNKSRAGFAINRRMDYSLPRDDFRYGKRPNPAGPVDHDVPVLKVTGTDGEIIAVLFGYACHSTTFGGYAFHGDYPGFAQHYIEEANPGAVALFLSGAGADQNPNPRGEMVNGLSGLDLARMHGRTLALAVESALNSFPKPVKGELKSFLEEVTLDYLPAPGRQELVEQSRSSNVTTSDNARVLLEWRERDGHLPDHYSYPIQVMQLGNGPVLIGLASEIVVDYSLRLKKEFPASEIWVTAYTNDFLGYIPSKRIQEEGGYEGGEAMTFCRSTIYRGAAHPNVWKPGIEEKINNKIQELYIRISN
jgi:neutral ceramidase